MDAALARVAIAEPGHGVLLSPTWGGAAVNGKSFKVLPRSTFHPDPRRLVENRDVELRAHARSTAGRESISVGVSLQKPGRGSGPSVLPVGQLAGNRRLCLLRFRPAFLHLWYEQSRGRAMRNFDFFQQARSVNMQNIRPSRWRYSLAGTPLDKKLEYVISIRGQTTPVLVREVAGIVGPARGRSGRKHDSF